MCEPLNILASVGPGFAVLLPEEQVLFDCASDAELASLHDPSSALVKLRGFAEKLTAIAVGSGGSLHLRIEKLSNTNSAPQARIDDLNEIRKLGNSAAHGGAGAYADACAALAAAHRLAIWLMETRHQRAHL
ncbi:unnamed protein product, partial [Laminaria digitata]